MRITKKAKRTKNINSKNSKRLNMVKTPRFLVIALILIVILVGLIYFVFLKYSPIMNFKYEGYAISGKEITENLLGASDPSDDEANGDTSKNIELTKIEEQGTIFKKLNDYFVGSKEKTEINLDYPIYINNNSAIYNLAEGSMLISKDFEQIASYPNLSISEGKIYDGSTLERADEKEYIFVKTSANIFINLYEIKIVTTANEYTIPVNSILAFTENELRYYIVKNNVLVFNQINDIDNNSEVQIVENSYAYEELLTKLGIIKDEANNNSNEGNTQNNIIQENTSNTENNSTKGESNNSANTNKEPTEEIAQGEQVYIKPEVSSTDFTAEVYTAQSTLSIKDPAGRIIEAPTFEVYTEGNIYLRRLYTNSGRIMINGLKPNTKYEIVGKYIYLNENEQKVENTFYEGSFTTKGYDALETISISKENGEIYNNKIQLSKVKITSDLKAEVIKGINKIEIVADGIKTTVKNEQTNMLLQGKEVTLETSEGLKSNKKIEYVIKIYDLLGEELKVENNKGETRTSKQEPIARVTVKEQDIVSVTLDLKLTNKDNAKMENYKYIITRPNGDKVKEEKLAENEKKIKIDDLDSNQYYEIKIYTDYDIEDGKGIQREKEIGKLVFATQPLSTLGTIEMKVEGKDISTTKAVIDYAIDEERTDKRLIQILEEITIEIIEKDTQEVTESKEITGEEIQKLKSGEINEQTYTNLKSNTIYEIRITSKVKQGSKAEDIQVTYNYKEFTTLRSTAKVEIQNQFVTGEMIDFDVRIEDSDNAVLNNKVRMELRDEDGNLIDLTEVETNKEYIRKTYDRLEEKKKYKLSFYADQYNEGSTDATYKINYLIKEMEILTEPGISGNIGLKSLLRKTTGKNLVDVESKVKWYTQCTGTWGYYNKEYNKEENVLKLWPGTKNNSQIYTYDLREYIGREVTISFNIKADDTIASIKINNSKNIKKNTTNIEGWNSKEYIEYQQTLIVNDTGYVGIYILNGTTQDNSYVYIKDLQIELGNKKTTYAPYQYTIQGEAIFSIEDKRNEIVNNDYYIKIYENNTEISNKRYEDIPEENTIINGIKDIDIKEDRDYKLELLVKVRDREYTLSTFEFNTSQGEILGITNEEEYRDIQPEGNYIVLNDLDFRDTTSGSDMKYRFGGRFGFNGTLNYNGHTVYINILSGAIQPLFYIIEENAEINNLNLKVYMNNDLATNSSIFFFTNRGKINNLMFELESSTKNLNRDLYLFGANNYGLIDNFILKLSSKLYGVNITCIANNMGEVKNGYLYGETIEIMKYASNTYNSVLASSNCGEIANIYSLININAEEIKSGDYFSKLVRNNWGAGNITNVYTVGLGTGYQIEINANSGNGGGRVSNSYYINDEIFKGTADSKTTEKVLYDTNFQNNVLNSENKFEVDELINQKYYPQLKMPECMPRQDYISLPEVEDADLPDVVSTTVLEQENKSALVQMNVYNPSGETITNVKIENITTNIVSQEYSEGQSSVIIELVNPIICVSTYSIMSITTKGAYNLPYTRDFEDGERYINIDLYNEIWNIDDWKTMRSLPNQNYKLMANLDFKNEQASTFNSIRLQGILDGNNYEIININIPSNVVVPLFESVGQNAKICNLYIKNYYISSNYYYLSVFGASRKATFENVHLENITLESTISGTGAQNTALMSAAEGAIIKNCTANNVKINVANKTSETYIGGFSAWGSSDIENSYINNLVIEETNNTNIGGIGGLVGLLNNESYNIKNSYVIGKICSNSGNIGGLIGYGGSCTITNSYAYVDIIGNGDYIGGIIGRDTASTSKINNNLYIGSIINKKTTGITGALAGNDVIGNNNYAYYTNKINGQLVKGKNILNYEDLSQINTYSEKLVFDANYNFETIDRGILPKLNYSNSNQLLPNQTDIYLSTEELSVENIEKLRIDNTNLQIQVTITNPANLVIKDLVIDDMEYTMVSNRNVDGKTYLIIQANPTKYYDTYRISKIIYENDGKEESKELYDLIEESFYKEISNFSDWQSIDENGYENYRLLADIDFSGRKDFKHNIKINKMVTNGQMHTLKNINLSTKSGNFGLIKESKSLIENIIFENIKIENDDNSGNFIGVISNNYGNINNVVFKDITLLLNSNNNYIGCIANSDGLEIKDISLENINISANNYIGGLFGYTRSRYVKEIEASDMTINGYNNIGGIIGYREQSTIEELSNIVIRGSDINGNDDVGGVWGSISGNGYIVQDIEVTNCKVKGNSNIGGIAGASGYNHKAINNVKVEESMILGNEVVGGIIGSGGNLNNGLVQDSEIVANNVNSSKVGGLIGNLRWNANKSGIVNSKVSSLGNEVGGFIGNGSSGNRIFAINTDVEGYSMVGGLVGKTSTGNLDSSYTNANVKGNDAVGGIVGYIDNINMDNQTNITRIQYSYYADGTIEGKEKVGGIIGEIAKEIYDESNVDYYQRNFVQADIISESNVKVSLGIGSNPEENVKLANTYFYKYSSINGENPNTENEPFINEEQYLVYEDLKQRTTYTDNLNFSTAYWNFENLNNGKYPMLHDNNIILEGQEEIKLPIDSEHILEAFDETKGIDKQPEQIFEYTNKQILTYNTGSIVTSQDGAQATRTAKLYVKDNKLYAVPIILGSTADGEDIVPLANNLIIDSYNGKEYETVLGSDGRLYDLKEPIKYPKDFVNKNIESIGNNLTSDSHEVEVTYKNGDKLKFNYQTGEIISSSTATNNTDEEKVGIIDYVKEKLAEIGNVTSDETISVEQANNYEASKELQAKLEEIPIEEAIEKQNSGKSEQDDNSKNNFENTEYNASNEANTAQGIDNNVTNNSLKEKKYITIYNEATGEYEIYDEEELLDTSKEEVVSENEKIEANNLDEYYASESETKNTKLGIVWIVLSIIGVGIVLFALKKNLRKGK